MRTLLHGCLFILLVGKVHYELPTPWTPPNIEEESCPIPKVLGDGRLAPPSYNLKILIVRCFI